MNGTMNSYLLHLAAAATARPPRFSLFLWMGVSSSKLKRGSNRFRSVLPAVSGFKLSGFTAGNLF